MVAGWHGLGAGVAVGNLLRAAGIGVLAGSAAGLLAGGVGGRGAMKVVALVAGPDARGRFTDNGNQIGAFTTETIFFLIFGAFLGAIGGLLYMALRGWLPERTLWSGLAFGAILLATMGTATLDARNFDFRRFGNPALNVGLFAALFLLFGLLVAPLAARAERLIPRLPFGAPVRPRAVLAVVPCWALGLAGIALLTFGIGTVLFQQEEDRSLMALLAALLAGALLGQVIPHFAPRGRGIVLLLLAVPVLLGAALTARAVGAIVLP
jgi:hypothetical protein